jgi:phosphoribosylamine---glycine ligase
MNKNRTIMIVWSGAREHVLADVYGTSELVSRIIVAPWNDYIQNHIKVTLEKSVVLTDVESVLKAARKHKPDLVDIAQDDALACGSVDALQQEWFKVFGPSKEASRIEWDKNWSREFMKKYNLPTPTFQYFDKESISSAKDFACRILKDSDRVFLKANNLHAWKGVMDLNKNSIEEVLWEFENILYDWEWFLVEEWLEWEEFSYYAMIDGKNSLFFPSAQDNKKVNNNDEWQNTWWMWAHCPASITEGYEQEIQDIIEKVVDWMEKEWTPYTGILYFGWIIWKDKKVNIIEFNARWWDPEAQVVIPALQNDYFDLVYNYYLWWKLNEFQPVFWDEKRMCIVWTVDPYPKDIGREKWKIIHWIQELHDHKELKIYGSWINVNENRDYMVSWGRFASFVSAWFDFSEIRDRLLSALSGVWIAWGKAHYRTDIAEREVGRQ